MRRPKLSAVMYLVFVYQASFFQPILTNASSHLLMANFEKFKREMPLEASPSLSVLRYYPLDTLMPTSEKIESRAIAFKSQTIAELKGVPSDTKIIDFKNSSLRSYDDFVRTSEESARWSSGFRQQGNEWIQLHFPEAQTLLGIKLQTKDFHSDYPRGIELFNCESNQSLIAIPKWLGSLHETSDGHWYFGNQSEVLIVLRKEFKTSCLRIKQISLDDTYDWSIAQIQLVYIVQSLVSSLETEN